MTAEGGAAVDQNNAAGTMGRAGRRLPVWVVASAWAVLLGITTGWVLGFEPPRMHRALPFASLTNPESLPGAPGGWTWETVGHRGSTLAAALRPGAKQAAILSQDGTLRLWDTDTGKLVAAVP